MRWNDFSPSFARSKWNDLWNATARKPAPVLAFHAKDARWNERNEVTVPFHLHTFRYGRNAGGRRASDDVAPARAPAGRAGRADCRLTVPKVERRRYRRAARRWLGLLMPACTRTLWRVLARVSGMRLGLSPAPLMHPWLMSSASSARWHPQRLASQTRGGSGRCSARQRVTTAPRMPTVRDVPEVDRDDTEAT